MMHVGKVVKFLLASAGLFLALMAAACAPAVVRSAGSAPQYYSPLQNAEYVSTGAAIAVRYGPVLNAGNLTGLKFTVQGSKSGLHEGRIILADDHKTVIFKPAGPFMPGEEVKVDVNGLALNEQTSFSPLSYSFKVATNQRPGSPITTSVPPTTGVRSSFTDFLTLPHDIPRYTVSTPSQDTGEGYIFVAPFYWTGSKVGSYLLILNGQGQIVYYQYVGNDLAAFDFKVQPNGQLSYWDEKTLTFYLMNSHYQTVDSYQAGNGYVSDLHDLQILPNGNALLMIYDTETMDMSPIVSGGKKNADVTGLVIQELDPSKNVIFEWRSWDHFSFFDTTSSLTDQQVDLIHGNALALANDGNLLLSSRNLSEITKINLQTGDVMWRMGGRVNMFKFVNGQPFAYQHDVRQLPNGDITLFDNHGTTQDPATSRGLEYRVDEINKTVTQVWEFTHVPPVFGVYMGNVQRLSNGNTFLSWGEPSLVKGYAYVAITEIAPDNSALFELSFDQPFTSYRAFRAPWQGFPDTQPALAFKADSSGMTLGYSWNGATEVAAYRVFGGNFPEALNLIEEKAKADFETQSHLTNLPKGECYFQVAALDKSGHEMARSKIISTDAVSCPAVP